MPPVPAFQDVANDLLGEGHREKYECLKRTYIMSSVGSSFGGQNYRLGHSQTFVRIGSKFHIYWDDRYGKYLRGPVW